MKTTKLETINKQINNLIVQRDKLNFKDALNKLEKYYNFKPFIKKYFKEHSYNNEFKHIKSVVIDIKIEEIYFVYDSFRTSDFEELIITHNKKMYLNHIIKEMGDFNFIGTELSKIDYEKEFNRLKKKFGI